MDLSSSSKWLLVVGRSSVDGDLDDSNRGVKEENENPKRAPVEFTGTELPANNAPLSSL